MTEDEKIEECTRALCRFKGLDPNEVKSNNPVWWDYRVSEVKVVVAKLAELDAKEKTTLPQPTGKRKIQL